MNKQIKGSFILTVTAIIWGCAFVAQEIATKHVGPFALNFIRFFIGGTVILPLLALPDYELETGRPKKRDIKRLLKAGILCGIAMTVATNLQNAGIMLNSKFTDGGADTAGFITALYIVVVPFFGLFFGRKPNASGIIGIILAVIGLYFICIKDGFSVSAGDILILLSAFAFAAQIVLADHFARTVKCVALSSVQFYVVSILSGILMLIFEDVSFGAVKDCAFSVLYLGILSSGAAYTLQIIGQKYCEPTLAALLMSLESLFCMIATCVYFHKLPTVRVAIGGAIMMVAMAVAQTPFTDRLVRKISRKLRRKYRV